MTVVDNTDVALDTVVAIGVVVDVTESNDVDEDDDGRVDRCSAAPPSVGGG